MTKFADDNKCYKVLLVQFLLDMKKPLEMIIIWLIDSGLNVNNLKMELCLFGKRDCALVTLNINGFEIKRNKTGMDRFQDCCKA